MALLRRRKEDPNDLGFGSVVSEAARTRLLNRDGSFNVRRRGLGFWSSLSPFQHLLTLSWPRFLIVGALGYLVLNGFFALCYFACGPNALVGGGHPADEPWELLLRAFFFSVETLSTIGYGDIVPATVSVELLVAVESVVGLISLAIATGLVFARFSRPTARIEFSRRAVMAPWRDGSKALKFRIVNRRHSGMIEIRATVILACVEKDGELVRRHYDPLVLERDQVVFFPLHWTIVHIVDEASPLYGVTHEELLACRSELLILLSGIDEATSQVVHARTSYRAEDIEWNADFVDIFDHNAESVTIDVRRLHDTRPV